MSMSDFILQIVLTFMASIVRTILGLVKGVLGPFSSELQNI